MKNILTKILATFIFGLFLVLLTSCDFSKFSLPRLTKKTEEIPVESYERSTLDNISSYDKAYTFKDVHKLIYGEDGYMPSVGDVNILVVPIKFRDIYTSKSNLEKYHTDLERTFFGTDTGYESLSSYYKKSSYGKLNISGTVLDWYTPTESSTYYENVYSNSQKNISKQLAELAMEAIYANG